MYGLSESSFSEVAKSILDMWFPKLAYSAGLLGFGSGVPGYGDKISADPNVGPAVLSVSWARRAPTARRNTPGAFSEHLPRTFWGYSVHFTALSDDPRYRDRVKAIYT